MKGAIFYYSCTGNTELACRYIAAKVTHAEFELFDITRCKDSDLSHYSIIGFAFPTYYLGVAKIFLNFIAKLDNQQLKPAFLLNTYGMMQGKALKLVEEIISSKGFQVVAWHTLMMPESYPPFIAKGMTGENQPDEKQTAAFNRFILELSRKLEDGNKGSVLEKSKVKIGFLNSLIGVKSRESILKDMGEFKVDSSLCNKCGRCVEHCGYDAIRLDRTPVWDSGKCSGCWSCFNHCAQKAIYTDRVKAANQYNGPDCRLTGKFL